MAGWRASRTTELSGAFTLTNGVKQGCVLAPTLFNLMFFAMLMDTYRDERPGIHIAYRTDGHILNHRRMHFQPRVPTTTVHKLLFTDDCALNTTSEGGMQRSMDTFSASCDNFGLNINTKKQGRHASTATPHSPQCATNCSAWTAPTVVSLSTPPSISTPSTNSDRPPEPPFSSSSSCFLTTSRSAAVASATHINVTNNPDISTNTDTTSVDTSSEGLVYTRPHCDRTFTSHIGLVGPLQIGEPVPGASTYSRRIRLHCLHYTRTFMHHMSLFGHMCIHEGGIDRRPGTSSTPTMASPARTPQTGAPTATSSITLSTSCKLTMLSPTHTTLPSAPTTITTTEACTDTADFGRARIRST
nr:unnamed protein product [Spirometra erinaceieuropaei]